MTSPYTGNLRITRVKYRGLGRYIKDHMDLKNFGHATNLDCSVSNGQTWLWTGSDCKGNDVSRAISGFRYQKNKTLRKHGTIHYKIPDAKSKKYMTNVYPAINQNSTQMAVRYTYGGKQYEKRTEYTRYIIFYLAFWFVFSAESAERRGKNKSNT